MNVEDLIGGGKTILLIDDNEIDLFINEKVINARKTGARIIKEQSPAKALELLEQKEPFQLPDIIFVDLNMPAMSGFEFLEQFERLPGHITGRCKVFMLTSSTHEQDINRATEFKSIIRYLTKPLDLRQLS